MAQQVKKCVSVDLIDGNGNFNTDGMKKFEEDAKLEEQDHSCGVVSVMGPQSSGKSTLLNYLFDTSFKVMNARLGRRQTTKGVCLGQTPLTESCLLVLDTEGSDAAERKDNTTFERQIALLVIATSGIVMINMWHHDVGRRNAASWPLLTIVFEVMPRIIEPKLRKVHLIFVLRDSDTMETPLEKLETQLIEQLEEIWNELPKRRDQNGTALSDHFKIEVVALPHYKYQKVQFEEKVAILREKVVCSLASSELTTNRTNASAFTEYTKRVWDKIKKNKDLDLPSLKVMVAEKRCNEIMEEKYQNFLDHPLPLELTKIMSNQFPYKQSWIEVKSKVDSGTVVQGFGNTVNPLIKEYLSKYDMETEYFDEGVRAAKKKLLEEKMFLVIRRTYQSLLERMRDTAMEDFVKGIADGLRKKKGKEELLEKIARRQTKYLLDEIQGQFDGAAIKQANWDIATTELERLRTQMDDYVKHIRPIIEEKGNEGVHDNIETLKMVLVVATLLVETLTGIPSFTGG